MNEKVGGMQKTKKIFAHVTIVSVESNNSKSHIVSCVKINCVSDVRFARCNVGFLSGHQIPLARVKGRLEKRRQGVQECCCELVGKSLPLFSKTDIKKREGTPKPMFHPHSCSCQPARRKSWLHVSRSLGVLSKTSFCSRVV